VIRPQVGRKPAAGRIGDFPGETLGASLHAIQQAGNPKLGLEWAGAAWDHTAKPHP